MTDLYDTITVDQAQLRDAVNLCIEAKHPLMIWGAPGGGKSAIVKAVADQRGMNFKDVRVTTLDPVDLRGIPKEVDGRTEWLSPKFLPYEEDGETLVLIDELTSASQYMQAALYELILDRRIGSYELPADVAIIAAGNRESDKGVVRPMPTPLASRFTHVTLSSDLKNWTQWALKSGIRSEVIFFLRFCPDKFYIFEPGKSKEQAFPCPRTWHFVSRLLDSMDKNPGIINGSGTFSQILCGTVGTVAGLEFKAFLDVYRECPDPQEIFTNPEHAQIPERPDVLLALCSSIYAHADDTNFGNIVTYAGRLTPEHGEFLIRMVVAAHEDLIKTREYIDWVVREENSNNSF